MGRFITVDPAEDGENWYAYCGGNPVNYVDPDGRYSYIGQEAWLLAGLFCYAWDTLKGAAELTKILIPYPNMPIPVNAVIVGMTFAKAVVNNPYIIIDFAKQIGWGLVADVVDTVRNYQKVVLGNPTDGEVRAYGKSLTGTVLTVIAAVKAGKAAIGLVNGGKVAIATSGEEAAGISRSSPQFWNKTTEFKGIKIYQRNDLIDPNRLDKFGRTNLERMQQGLSPIGPDGKSLNLHHMLQTQNGPIAEITQTFQQMYYKIIHINPNTIPSGINRTLFNAWRESYWIQRALDFIQ